jgi:ubiquitination network signaling protein AcrB
MAGGASGSGDGRDRSISDVSLDGRPDDCSYEAVNGSAGPSTLGPPRRFDGTTSAVATKTSTLTMATTILSSCPLRDVIAILIILLQLGPTALTIVHSLFAILTLVPPTSPTSLSTLPSLSDMFQGTGGSPSVALIIFVDVVILIIWCVLWLPLQNYVLDLAQAVIAIMLGGAAAGRGGSTNSVFICGAIITISHLGQSAFLRQHFGHYAALVLSKGGIQSLQPLQQTSPGRSSYPSSPNLFRIGIDLHILAQGLLRWIRRALSRREQHQPLPASKKVDPEAGIALATRASSAPPEGNPDVPNNSSTDGRTPGLPPATRDARDKVSNSKKKRRQATHVRSQQPFWAAIASTKVTVLKEMEQSRVASDAEETQARDSNLVGNANFKPEEDRIWISNIGSTEISFGARLFRPSTSSEEEDLTTTDLLKPFVIRLNGAVWSSTRQREISTNACVDEGSFVTRKGEIFGLTAFSNYHIEFVRPDGKVLSTASIITLPGSSTETGKCMLPWHIQKLVLISCSIVKLSIYPSSSSSSISNHHSEEVDLSSRSTTPRYSQQAQEEQKGAQKRHHRHAQRGRNFIGSTFRIW